MRNLHSWLLYLDLNRNYSSWQKGICQISQHLWQVVTALLSTDTACLTIAWSKHQKSIILFVNILFIFWRLTNIFSVLGWGLPPRIIIPLNLHWVAGTPAVSAGFHNPILCLETLNDLAALEWTELKLVTAVTQSSCQLARQPWIILPFLC